MNESFIIQLTVRYISRTVCVKDNFDLGERYAKLRFKNIFLRLNLSNQFLLISLESESNYYSLKSQNGLPGNSWKSTSVLLHGSNIKRKYYKYPIV